MNVSNSDDIVGQLLAATSKVTHEALHGVRIEIDGVRTADLTPSAPGSLYRGQQLVVFGHYWGDGTAEVRLNGHISGDGRFTDAVDLDLWPDPAVVPDVSDVIALSHCHPRIAPLSKRN